MSLKSMLLRQIPVDVYAILLQEQARITIEKGTKINLTNIVYRIIREWFRMKYTK